MILALIFVKFLADSSLFHSPVFQVFYFLELLFPALSIDLVLNDVLCELFLDPFLLIDLELLLLDSELFLLLFELFAENLLTLLSIRFAFLGFSVFLV